MKYIGHWIIAIIAFTLGFYVNEYRHQQIGSQLNQPSAVASADNISTSSVAPQALPDQSPVTATTQASPEYIQQLINQQDYKKAIEQLKIFLQHNPADAQGWYWLALCYQSENKLTLAVETWLEYLKHEMDTDRANHAIANLKRLLQQLGRNPATDNENTNWLVEQINQLLDISINDSQLHLLLAQLLLNSGDEYQAQYHALMAVNEPSTQQQAEKILAQLDGDLPQEPMQLPLTRFGEQFIVTAYIENIPANLLLDTGASISGVTNRYIKKYPAMVKNTKPIRLNTASGTQESYLFTVDAFHMGSALFNQHMLAVLPVDDVTEFDGLLGVDILGKFDFVIDQNNAVLKLSPRGQ